MPKACLRPRGRRRLRSPCRIRPARDLQLEPLVEILEGKRLVHAHCYRADEMAQVVDMAKEFGYRVAAFGWRTPLAAPVRRPTRALIDAAGRRGAVDESLLLADGTLARTWLFLSRGDATLVAVLIFAGLLGSCVDISAHHPGDGSAGLDTERVELVPAVAQAHAEDRPGVRRADDRGVLDLRPA